MTVDYFFIGLIVLAGMLTVFCMMRPEWLLRMAAGLTWLALAFWTFLSGELTIGDSWVIIVAAVFLVMAFVPLVFQINTEVWRENKGRRWVEWSRRPRDADDSVSPYEQYRQELRDRINRHGR